MKTTIKMLTTGMILSATLLTACQKDNKSNSDEMVRVKNSSTSTELADAAEQLVTPYTFMLASKVADMALEKDPNNVKAQFYKKFLARTEVFRGIQARVKPLLKTAKDLQRWEDEKKKLPDSPVKTFLYTATKPEIKTVTDAQNILGEYVTAVGEFRTFLKQSQASEVTLNLNPAFFSGRIAEQSKDNCRFNEGDNGEFDFKCDNSGALQVKLNSADFVVLSQMAAGEMLYFGLYNNYSLEGVDKLENQLGPEPTKHQVLSKLLSNPEFGKLRQDNTISIVKEIGAEYSAAAKWAIQYQQQLCPKGMAEKNQRRGYLFSTGICVTGSDDANKSLAVLDQALASIIQVDIVQPNSGEKMKINVDPFALSKNPVADLRSIAPTAYNSCDQVTAVADNSLGGTFVDKNFDILFATRCQ